MAVLEDDLCPGCRMPLSESTDPDGPAYTVPPPALCRSCNSLHRSIDDKRDSKSSIPMAARKFSVTERGVRG